MLDTGENDNCLCGSTGMPNPYPYDPKKTVLSVEENKEGFYLTVGRSLINGIASLFRKESVTSANSDSNSTKAVQSTGK